MNIFTFTIYLSFIFHQSYGFEVIQPQNQTVNPDRSASISCEHTANVSSVEDVELYGIPSTDKKALCKKGQKDCKNITMYKERPNKWLFIILNIGPEAMKMKYRCEFTVKKGDVDVYASGTPTVLLPGQKEEPYIPQPQPPPQHQFNHLIWILIGLLAALFLYSCVITSIYIKLRISSGDPENSIYVEMRTAPPPRNPHYDIYCG